MTEPVASMDSPLMRGDGSSRELSHTASVKVDLASLLRRLTAIADAAQFYFDGYCQDEAADDGPCLTGCSHKQHRAAAWLGAALAGYSEDECEAAILQAQASPTGQSAERRPSPRDPKNPIAKGAGE